jgi:hypothetical protein
MGSSSSSSKSTTTKTPYGPATPVLNRGADIMSNYLSNPNSTAVYSGPRVANLSQDTQTGQQMLRDSTGANASQDYLMSLLSAPQNIQDNPQVQAMQDAIRRQVQATSNSQFSNAGTVGGTANVESLSKGLADGLAQPLFQAYESDQDRRLNAAGQLPAVGQQIINNQLTSGQITDSYNQAKINAAMQAFEDKRTAPIKAWSEVAPTALQLGSAFGTNTQNTTTTQDPSLGSQILGGALAGVGLASGLPGAASAITAPWTWSAGSSYQAPSTPYASNSLFNLNYM